MLGLEVEYLHKLASLLSTRQSWEGLVLQGLDLRAHTEELLRLPVKGALFLGCEMEPQALQHCFLQGALIFPKLSGMPFDPYRGHLYTVAELYAGFDPQDPASYKSTLDAQVYDHWHRTGKDDPDSMHETLARRLHDLAVTDAIQELLKHGDQPWRVIAIMGGHGLSRAAPTYRSAAWIARALTRQNFLMASGGGPGAMEATHLGAYLAPFPDEALDEALALLATAPKYTDPRWLSAAFEVRARFPLSSEDAARHPSLGIPTWLYGHEPPNAFATHIAKYFANSVREDGLLAIATYGVVYAPGSAGTIQEIFQDACQNHYKTVGVVSPMVFLDRDYWTRQKPVYPLLEQLAQGHDYARYLSLHDDPQEVLDALLRYAEERAAG
jgi:predicted Rossmann-fold nucleotide-binding protein